MHSLASTVNGIGAAQRLGHHDRRLVQIIESQVLAHALERVRRFACAVRFIAGY